jgi:hypothetical protein
MTASWTGARHPTNLVNAVSNSTVTLATLPGGQPAYHCRYRIAGGMVADVAMEQAVSMCWDCLTWSISRFLECLAADFARLRGVVPANPAAPVPAWR